MSRKRDAVLVSRGPWIPDPSEIARMRDDLDYALSADLQPLYRYFDPEPMRFYGPLILAKLGETK